MVQDNPNALGSCLLHVRGPVFVRLIQKQSRLMAIASPNAGAKKIIGCNYEIRQETGCPKNWEYSSERLKVSHQSVLNTCVVVCSVLCSLTMISSTLYTAAKMSGWVNPRMRADCSHSQVLLAAERARVRHHGTKHRSPQKRQQQARQNYGVVKTQGPSRLPSTCSADVHTDGEYNG